MSGEILTFDAPQAAAEACGAVTLQLLESARQARGRASLAVSGGSTPRVMFEWMARQPFDWKNVDLFWVDERCVPPDDGQSNYRMTRESLLDHVTIWPERVHRIRGEMDPAAACEFYIKEIRSSLALEANELPEFDIVQRGMGADGHTASLFPGEPLIANQTDLAAALWVEKMKQHRVTLLPGVLARARHTLCLATGAEKRTALQQVLDGPEDPFQFPAQLGRQKAVWYVDRAARP